jgi:uncharacterized protein
MADGESKRAARKPMRPGKFNLAVKRSSAGLGLFTRDPIPAGACVIEYVGNKLTEAEYQKSKSVYLFDIGPRGALDGSPRWNRARYINHSCIPNCYWSVRNRRVYILASRRIEPDEELGYDYGSEYFDEIIGKNCKCRKCKPDAHRR